MTRPSKKVREEAILICAIAASDSAAMIISEYYEIRSALGLSAGLSAVADSLARRAFGAVYAVLTESVDPWEVLDAEAECLLRDGWCPGDKVVRR